MQASDGEDEEADEEEDDEEDEGAESEEEVDPLDGEDLLDEEEDALEKCMGFPAFEVADSIFDDAGEVVEHAAYALVDKISLRENRQNLQTCVRMYCLARPQAVDLKMNFHRKTRDDKPTECAPSLSSCPCPLGGACPLVSGPAPLSTADRSGGADRGPAHQAAAAPVGPACKTHT